MSAAAAATAFSGHATAVLDAVARTGLSQLKSGGVGARELTRLAKSTAADEVEVRLVLELAAEAGLLDTSGQRVTAGAGFAAWRDTEPAARYGDLVAAWWRSGIVPSQARDEGKAVPALRHAAGCAECRGARHALLGALAAVDEGGSTSVTAIGRAALWSRPLVHAVADDGDVPFAAPWREAELLGLVAHGALTPLGRHLAAGDEAAVRTRAAAVLPGTVDTAVFGPDLTAVVTGTPSARVTTLLDSCADRESRGGAVVWRLSPGSVRRALDDGTPGPGAGAPPDGGGPHRAAPAAAVPDRGRRPAARVAAGASGRQRDPQRRRAAAGAGRRRSRPEAARAAPAGADGAGQREARGRDRRRAARGRLPTDARRGSP